MENKQMWLLLNDLVDNTTKVSSLCPGDCPCFKLLEQAQQLIYRFIEACYCIRKVKGFSKAEIKKRILASRKDESETDKEQNINTLLEVFDPQAIDCPRCQHIFKQLKGKQCTELEKYVLMDKMCTHCKIKLTSKLYRKSYEKLSAERHYGTLMSQVNDWSYKAEKFFARNRDFLARTRSETGRGPLSTRSDPQHYEEYGLPSERGVGLAEGRDRYQRPMAGYPGQPRGREPIGDEFAEDRYQRPKSDGYPGQLREDYYEGRRQREVSRFGAFSGRQKDFYEEERRAQGARPGYPEQHRDDLYEDRERAPGAMPGYPGQPREYYDEDRGRAQRGKPGHPGQAREDYDEYQGRDPRGKPGYSGQAREDYDEDRGKAPRGKTGFPGQAREDYYEDRGKAPRGKPGFPGQAGEDYYEDRGKASRGKPGFPGQAREDYYEDRGKAPRGEPGFPGQAREDYDEDRGRAPRSKPGYPGQAREDYYEDRGKASRGKPSFPGQAREDYDEDRGKAPRRKPGFPGQAQEDYDEDRGRAPKGKLGVPGQAREDYDEDRGRASRGKPGQPKEDYYEDRGRTPKAAKPGQSREDYDEDRGRASRGKPGQPREDYYEDRGRAPKAAKPGQSREDYDEDRGRASRGKPGQPREDYYDDRSRAPKVARPGQPREEYAEDRGKAPRGKPIQSKEGYDEVKGQALKGKPGQAKEDYDKDRAKGPKTKPSQAKEGYDEVKGQVSKGKPGQAKEGYDEVKGQAPKGKPGQAKEGYDEVKGPAPKGKPGQAKEDYDEVKTQAPKGKPGQAKEGYDEVKGLAPKGKPGQAKEGYDDVKNQPPKGKPGQAKEIYDEDKIKGQKAKPGQTKEGYDEVKGQAPKGKPGQAKEDYGEDKGKGSKAKAVQAKEDDGSKQKDKREAVAGRDDQDEGKGKLSKAKTGQAKEDYGGKLQKEKPDGRGDAEDKDRTQKIKPGQTKEDKLLPDAAVKKQPTKDQRPTEGQARKESLSKDKTGPGQTKPGKSGHDEGSKQVQDQKTKATDVSKKKRQDEAKSEEGSKAKTSKIPPETAEQKPSPGEKIKGLDALRKQQEEEARSKKKEGQTPTDKSEKEFKKDTTVTKDSTAPKGKEAPVSKTTGKIEPEPLAGIQKKIEDQKDKSLDAKQKGKQDETKAKAVEKETKGINKVRLVSSDEQAPVSKIKGQVPADKLKTPLPEPKSFEERIAQMQQGPHITISKLLAIKQAERQKKEEEEPKVKVTGKGGDQISGLSPENKEVMVKFLKMINDRQLERDREKKMQELELQKLEALKNNIITKGDVKIIKSRMTEMIEMKKTKFMLPFSLDTDVTSTEILKSSSESSVPTVIYRGHVAKKNSDLEKEIEREQDQYLPYRVPSESCDISDFLLEAAKLPEDPTANVELHKKKRETDKEVKKPTNGVRYALSDPKFIDIGWTKLPSMKLVRKVNVYQTTLAKPNFDWFSQNKNKGPIFYETGERLADFIDNRGFWFYKNGKIALECHKSEEPNAKRRYTVYSNSNTEKYPDTVLASFDHLGNGIIYDNVGNIRLKYNQYEGKLLDRSIGPETHWKWNSLNEPPDLQHVLVDMKLQYKDPRIVELDTHSRDLIFKDDGDMIAIETENQIKQMNKATSQDFRKYGVRIKTIKINDNFSLRMIDQSTIYLNFNEDNKRLKLHLGIEINHREIVGTDTTEAGEMTNLEKLPAITESIAAIQRTIKNSNQKDQMLTEKMAWKRPRSPGEDKDRMLAAVSKPLRLPLIEEPKVDIEQLKQCYYHHCLKKNVGCKT